MNVKKALMCLLIVAILTLCVQNFVAASPTTPTVAPHSKIVAGVNAGQSEPAKSSATYFPCAEIVYTYGPYTLSLRAPSHVTSYFSFEYGGRLTKNGQPVSGAPVYMYWRANPQDNWTSLKDNPDITDANGYYDNWMEFHAPTHTTMQLCAYYSGPDYYILVYLNIDVFPS